MRSIKIPYLSIALLAAVPLAATPFASAQPDIRFVDKGVTNSGDGTSWSSAKKYLREALAISGVDEIRVKAATYYPDEGDGSTDDRREDTFSVPADVQILGGYDPNGGSNPTRDPATYVTTLSGNIRQDGTNKSYHVVYIYNADNVHIDGFTIRDGYADGDSQTTYDRGAGLYFENANDLTLTDCTIRNNEAISGGAGVWMAASDDFTLSGCKFIDNTSHADGGAARLTGETTVTGCEFTNNRCYHDGSAIYAFAEDDEIWALSVTSSLFDDNDAYPPNSNDTGDGTVRLINFVAATFDDVDFVENYARYGGSAIAGDADPVDSAWPSLIIKGGSFTGNIADNHYGAVSALDYRVEINNDAQTTRTDFNYNELTSGESNGVSGALYIASLITPYANVVKRCDFTGNTAERGGAAWFKNVQADLTGCTFDGNEAVDGGGAIWADAGDDTRAETITLNLTGCKFRANQMTNQNSEWGGGGVFLGGFDEDYDGVARGTWTNCDFIDNVAVRGGGAYLWSTKRVSGNGVDIKDCRFLANGNTTATKAGGGLCIADAEEFGGMDVRISKTNFVSNAAKKGGAIHNHEGAKTYMVNCTLAGNSSTEEGGAVFNSKHNANTNITPEMHMHNCLIVGNVADNDTDGSPDPDVGGGVFSGLDVSGFTNDLAITELIHCTLIANHAGNKYGGAFQDTGSGSSHLRFYNTIARFNTDGDDSTTEFQNQLYHTSYPEGSYGDIDNFVMMPSDEGLPGVYAEDDITWTDGDPSFTETSTNVTWSVSDYDPATGTTTFTVTSASGGVDERFFRPAPSGPKRLLIKEIPNSNTIVCWGKWAELSGQSVTTTIRNYHIGSSGVADNFGHTSRVPPDVCDIDGDNNEFTTILPWDFDEDTREVGAPDCGVYEIQP